MTRDIGGNKLTTFKADCRIPPGSKKLSDIRAQLIRHVWGHSHNGPPCIRATEELYSLRGREEKEGTGLEREMKMKV